MIEQELKLPDLTFLLLYWKRVAVAGRCFIILADHGFVSVA
jgi:hypothetical protein